MADLYHVRRDFWDDTGMFYCHCTIFWGKADKFPQTGSLWRVLYCLYVLRAAMQGMGDALIPMLSSFVQVFMRIMCALLLTLVIGNEGVFWGEVSAWIGADLLLLSVLPKRMRMK